MDTIIPPKRCNKCLKEFPATREFFVTGTDSKDGLRPLCKPCRSLIRPDRKPRYIPPEGFKRCEKCLREFPATLEFFLPNTRKPGVFRPKCKECYSLEEFQCCSVCEKVLPATLDYFSPDVRSTSGFASCCKKCRRPIQRAEHAQKIVDMGKVPRRKGIDYERIKHCHRVQKHRRRARELSVGGTFTSQEIKDLYARQKDKKCYYCRRKLTKYHLEHVIPLSRGGTNDIGNLVFACPTCNLKKGNKLPHEWPQGNRLL